MRRVKSRFAKAVYAILTATLMMAPSAWASSKYHVLYKFKGGKNGAGPNGALVADAAGNLYGVTATGGYGKNGGCGTVFEVSRAGNGWDQKVLYRFPGNGNDGCIPIGNLAFDTKGNLYGTSRSGGQGNCFGQTCGTVFELTPNADGSWKETVIHRFTGGSDGEAPYFGVVLDAADDVYGTTTGSCDTSCNYGTVFELTPLAGGGWMETILHAFGDTDGANPSGLVFDTAGNLYGVTTTGGTYGWGVAFELSPTSGGGWDESTIYNFQGFSDGALPGNGLTFRGSNLYGATPVAGAGGVGTIFELKHESDGSWTHDVLYNFTGGKDGRYPYGPFVFDKSGSLYGSTGGDVGCLHGYHWRCGNVFELMPESEGQWKLQVLHTFPGGSHGAFPSQLMSDGQGNLYGTADGGSTRCPAGGCGVVFELTPRVLGVLDRASGGAIPERAR